MKHSAAHIVEEVASQQPLLVVDRYNELGSPLAAKLLTYTPVVFVTQDKEAYKLFPPGLHSLVAKPYTLPAPQLPHYRYGAMFLVFHPDILDQIPSFVAKATEQQCNCILVVPLRYVNPTLLAQAVALSPLVRVVIAGDVFGNDLADFSPGIVRDLFREAKKTNRVQVPDMGLSPIYPVYVDDMLDALLRVTYVQHPQQLYFAFSHQSPTLLSFARLLHKADPLLAIDFIKTDYTGFVIDPTNGVYLLGNDYPLLSRLRTSLASLLAQKQPAVSTSVTHDRLVHTQHQHETHRSFLGPFLFWSLCLLVFVAALPGLATLGFALLGANTLQEVQIHVATGDLTQAAKAAKSADVFLGLAVKSYDVLEQEAALIEQQARLAPLAKRIHAGKDISESATALLDAGVKLKAIFTGTSSHPKQELLSAQAELKRGITLLQKLQSDGTLAYLTSLYGSEVTDITRQIDLFLQFGSTTIDVFPSLIGFEGKKDYLVLFQNNMELRPGGGFIGSFGLVTLDQGKVSNFVIQDVYDADGQLQGHIEPPFPLRRHLPTPHLYLRDSNFSLDFAAGASSSALLLQEELGKQVDGVIAVDVSFVQLLVGALGKVYVPDYKETVTQDTFYMMTQKHAEKNFFPGSTQKKDFLRSLFLAIKLQMETGRNISYIRIANALAQGMQEKHILFAFSDTNVQSLFTVNGFSSSLWDRRGEAEDRINDFFGVNEANFGVNKTNYFLHRKIEQAVAIDGGGEIRNTITLRYKNEGTTWPGGGYKAYVRLIVPQNATLETIAFDGTKQQLVPAVTDFVVYEAKRFVPPAGLEVARVDEFDKTTYGFLLTVDAGSFKTVTVTYKLAKVLSVDMPTFQYNLRVFKQPGTNQDDYVFSLAYPQAFAALKMQGEAIGEKDGVVIANTKLTTDKIFDVTFSRK